MKIEAKLPNETMGIGHKLRVNVGTWWHFGGDILKVSIFLHENIIALLYCT